MKQIWSLKGQNRGASLIAVLVTIMFVSMIGIVISQITITNIQMKEVERRGKTNFYDAETVMNDLSAGANTKAADAMQKAYSEILSKYRTVTATGGDAQVTFSRKYIDHLIAIFKAEDADDSNTYYRKVGEGADAVVVYQVGSYNLDTLKDCFSDDEYKDFYVAPIKGYYYADYENATFVLKDVEIQVPGKEGTGYSTSIRTDLVFSTPELNFEGNYMVKEFMRYCLIADEDIDLNAKKISVLGNVYAGAGGIKSGIEVTNNTDRPKLYGNTIITRGDISVDGSANVVIGYDSSDSDFPIQYYTSNIWAENIRTEGTSGATISLNGNMYIADDLEMDGENGVVNLKGKYFGYNFQKNYGASESFKSVSSEFSSSISLNGRTSKLSLLELDNLMLAGRTYLRRKVNNIDLGIGDVPLGESLSVRSNQMAYYVSDKLLNQDGVEPRTFDESEDPADKKGKKVSDYFGVGNIYKYVNRGNPVVAFKYARSGKNSDKDTYYYLNFINEQAANNFFSEYYESHKDGIDHYGSLYTADDALILPTSTASDPFILTLRGDVMYRASSGDKLEVGRIDIHTYNLDGADFFNYAARLATKYKSMQLYLDDSHKGVTAANVRFIDEDTGEINKRMEDPSEPDNPDKHTLFNNLINVVDLKKELENKEDKKIVYTYDASGNYKPEGNGEYVVILYDNEGGETLTLDASCKGGIIIATGDVLVSTAAKGSGKEFTGCIISGNEIKFGAGASINSNELLVSQLFSNDLKKSDRKFTQFFKGYETVTDSDMGIVRIDRYLSYDNWTKTVD